MQGIQLRLGTNVFSKEQKLQEQQRTINELTVKLQDLQEKYESNLQSSKENEKLAFEYKGVCNILKIEKEQLEQQCKQLQRTSKQQQEQNKKLTDINAELQAKLKALSDMQHTQDTESNTLSCTNQRLSYELDHSERRSVQLEKMIADMQTQREEYIKQIQLLEKSNAQKDKHVAILLKEKDRLYDKENELMQHQRKPKQEPVPQEPPKVNDKEMKRLKQQNMDLIVRLKNRK